jgi:radical SAM protein (TIGR01212 family)
MDGSLLANRLNLLGPWLKTRFGGPVVKIGLETGLSCPNRDGTLGRAGCAWCPPAGSGRGRAGLSVSDQLAEGLARLRDRAERAGKRPGKLPPLALAYFQAHTSTHGPPERLRAQFQEALTFPEVAGVIVSTRPDCLDGPRWEVLAELAAARPFWLELGLQSAHDLTLKSLGRGHDAACFARAVAEASRRGIAVVAHVILGLPGETPEHTEATADFLAGVGEVWGVKMHNLMVLDGAPLAEDWRAGGFEPWDLATWTRAAGGFLARLPREVVVHRLAADPGADRLLAPAWAGRKDLALAALARYLEEHDLKQGALCP